MIHATDSFGHGKQDTPIGEDGDVSGAKFQEIRKVVSKYVDGDRLPEEPPPLPARAAYGEVTMKAMGSIFEVLRFVSDPPNGIKVEWPVPMERLRQGFGFILNRSYLPANVRPGSRLTVMEESLDYVDILLADVVKNKRTNESFQLIDSGRGKIQMNWSST